jgi:hypothetical protein
MCETAHVKALAGRIGNQNLQWFSQRQLTTPAESLLVALPFDRLAGYAERNR